MIARTLALATSTSSSLRFIQWEAGTASGGDSQCQGGSPARVGYSNGTSTSFEMPGSGTSGAFLDSNPSTGLIHNSRNSFVLGRYIFPVRNGVAPTGGSISGQIFGNDTSNPLAVSLVQVCSSANFCNLTQTNGLGQYSVSGLDADTYTVTAFPPSGTGYQNGSIQVVLGANQALTGQDIILVGPTPAPNGVTITNNGTTGNGVPSVYWQATLTLTAQGCPGGTADYQLTQGSSVIRSGPMTEGPSGTYSAAIQPLYPVHGSAHISITIHCPSAPDDNIGFDIYIDPSGHVLTAGGEPVAGATVTLFRSDSFAGPFSPVPDGSAIMSATNRSNPDTTASDGFFGWDVIAGFYQVQASYPGCVSPTNPAQPFAQTDVLEVPPPALGLDITLACPADVAISLTAGPSGSVNVGDSFSLTYAVSNSGPEDVDSITLTIPVPGNVTPDTASLPAECALSSGVITCTFDFSGSGSIGDLLEHSFSFTANAAGSAEFDTSVAGDVADGNTANNVVMTPVDVESAPVAADPDAVDDSFTVEKNTPLSFSLLQLLANDSDPQGEPIFIVGFTTPDTGTITPNADGVTANYVPPTDFVGTATMTYTIADPHGHMDTASITFDVVDMFPANQPPDAVDDSLSTDAGTPLTFPVTALLSNDTDPDGDTLLIANGTLPSYRTMVFNNNGTVTYTPAAGFTGDDTFTYTVADNNGNTDTATVTITVG